MFSACFTRPIANLRSTSLWTTRRCHSAIRRPKALPEFTLENKVCVVTGAARGLGYVMCKAFLESGCTSLAMIDLVQADADAAAAKLVATFVDNGLVPEGEVQAIGVECDVSSEMSVKAAMSQVVHNFGRIDTLVTSAGIIENYTAMDYPYERIKRLYDVNVHGALFCAREAARDMLQRKAGSIVLIGSMSANIVNIPQTQMPYNASKAGKHNIMDTDAAWLTPHTATAVKQMAASLAVEWAKSGVRVNTLSPGYMLTELTKQVLSGDKELRRTWESLTPMGRMGDPEELKGAVVFLASDASRFVTGSEVRVDGGYSIV